MSKLKALTFLGTGPKDGYQKTTYLKHDDNKPCTTHLFPEAVAKLYEPEQIIVFATPQVQKDPKGYLAHLRKELSPQLCEKEIRNGNSTEELWEIFKACEAVVDPGDPEIILDITHAFRSLPLLVFTVAVYLRQVKQVELKHIIYGAFEARDSSKNETPIFDLTPFVSLLDWTNAVNVFQRTGDARPIAELDIHNDISDALTKLSESLLTNRTIEVQEAAFKFNGLDIDELVTEHKEGSQAPFRMLIEQLQDNYKGMAVNDPRNKPEQSIKVQYDQIKWYIDNQHYFQAITLIREWLVSWEYLQWRPRRGDDWLRRRYRKPVEDRFNEEMSAAPEPDEEAWDLWDACKDIRNDLAHCGMRVFPAPRTANEAIDAIKEMFDYLEEFARDKSVIS